MTNKDALFEDILNSWINEISSNPIPEIDVFIKSYKLPPDDENNLRSILLNVLPIKKSLWVSAPIDFKNKLMGNLMIKFKEKYRGKPQKDVITESIEKLLHRRQPQVQLSYREKEKKLSEKDKKIIDEFLKELGGDK
jgi:hypothetical protein